MDDLCSSLRAVLKETFLFYLQAHMFHWNVEGPTFSQLHDLFGALYGDAFEAVDDVAEIIRTLGEKAPQTTSEIAEDGAIVPCPCGDASAMVRKLCGDNEILKAVIAHAQSCAEDSMRPEIANFMQERWAAHDKWGWKLKATLGAAEAGVTVRQFTLYTNESSYG